MESNYRDCPAGHKNVSTSTVYVNKMSPYSNSNYLSSTVSIV